MEDKDKKPLFEVEESGCSCEGIESDWVWDKDRGMHVCSGCGDVQ